MNPIPRHEAVALLALFSRIEAGLPSTQDDRDFATNALDAAAEQSYDGENYVRRFRAAAKERV